MPRQVGPKEGRESDRAKSRIVRAGWRVRFPRHRFPRRRLPPFRVLAARARPAAFRASPYICAILLRAAFLLLVPYQLRGDALDYHHIAANIADGHGFSRCTSGTFPLTAQRPPLYPYLLAAAYFLGFSPVGAAFGLNVLFDFAAMYFAERWATALGFRRRRAFPWLIALCPFLITYGVYPTTENLSVALFFIALWASVRPRVVVAGLGWGLLALSRSYMLLFPLALLVVRPFRHLSRARFALIAAVSLAPPSLWVARNFVQLGRPTFSQSSTVAFQSYLGLCHADFDWWRADQVAAAMSVPAFERMTHTACMTDEQIGALDREMREHTRACVAAHPIATLRNVAAKTHSLFVNWGQLSPYNHVPELVHQAVNCVLLLYWWCFARLLWARRRVGEFLGFSGGPRREDAIRFSLLAIGYVTAVTLPFGVDARYLLAPLLVGAMSALELADGYRPLLEAGFDAA